MDQNLRSPSCLILSHTHVYPFHPFLAPCLLTTQLEREGRAPLLLPAGVHALAVAQKRGVVEVHLVSGRGRFVGILGQVRREAKK